MSGQLLKINNWQVVARAAQFRPATMAGLCSVSLRQLERHFAHEFKTTPGKWSRDFRFKLAQELISKGWSNKAIASELAFTDNAHLCREFKRKCGKTPHRSALASLKRGEPGPGSRRLG